MNGSYDKYYALIPHLDAIHIEQFKCSALRLTKLEGFQLRRISMRSNQNPSIGGRHHTFSSQDARLQPTCRLALGMFRIDTFNVARVSERLG